MQQLLKIRQKAWGAGGRHKFNQNRQLRMILKKLISFVIILNSLQTIYLLRLGT